jgi:hypothetical protein
MCVLFSTKNTIKSSEFDPLIIGLVAVERVIATIHLPR